jgi:predicted CDP-diglyceride synthetase/phosphatidate cytidylyltransferase
VRWTLAGIGAALALASLVVLVLGRVRPDRDDRELRLRIRTGWTLPGSSAWR